MAMDSENIKGRAYAFGTWSAISPRGSVLLRPLLGILSHARARIDATHFASWVIVPQRMAAALAASETEPQLRRGYLLFLSAFNGEREDYFHGLWNAFGPAIGAIWSHCERWPGVWQIRSVLEYVQAHELFADTFFNAYGDATAEDIHAALRLTRALEEFALAAPANDARQFRR